MQTLQDSQEAQAVEMLAQYGIDFPYIKSGHAEEHDHYVALWLSSCIKNLNAWVQEYQSDSPNPAISYYGYCTGNFKIAGPNKGVMDIRIAVNAQDSESSLAIDVKGITFDFDAELKTLSNIDLKQVKISLWHKCNKTELEDDFYDWAENSVDVEDRGQKIASIMLLNPQWIAHLPKFVFA